MDSLRNWFRRFRSRRTIEQIVRRPMTQGEQAIFDRAFKQLDIVYKNMDATFKELEKLRWKR